MENFNKLDLIGDEQDFEDEELRLSKDKISFSIDELSPLKMTDKTSAYIDEIEPLFLDKRLTSAINFAYLPPQTQRAQRGPRGIQRTLNVALGEYPDLRQSSRHSFGEILSHLTGNAKSMQIGMMSLNRMIPVRGKQKPLETVSITNGSDQNNMIFQIFESNNQNGTIKKLDIINHGQHRLPFQSPASLSSGAEVDFAGKIFLTKTGLPTFVNIFTIIID